MLRNYKKISLLVIAIILICCNSVFAETEHFEKGDLLFRGKIAGVGYHTGIYHLWNWNMDPDERESHYIIEAPGAGKTVWFQTYDYFFNTAEFKRGGSLYPTAAQRQQIIESAHSRIGYDYNFTKGYKDRMLYDEDIDQYRIYRTYRCDGLAEHIYEITLGGDGIVNDTDWKTLSPYKQMGWMPLPRPIPPTISSIVITPSTKDDQGKYHIKKTVTIKCPKVSDGSRGSGIRRVEFWLDGRKIGTDDHPVLVKGTYKITYDTTTVDNGEYTLYAKAFDQAGNYKIASVPVVIENVAAIEKTFSWQGYDLKLTFERDTQGPVYTIYYKEKAEDTTWAKWGEYDTKDSGLYAGDIILNLALNIPEYESEADDAGRFTHQCKLTAIGKDVFI